MVTAYDFFTASVCADAGADIILVGDSLGMTVLGYESTREVTMEDMLHHTAAVMRAKTGLPVIADMPVNTYDTTEKAIRNAERFASLGCGFVKIEGPMPETAEAITKAGIKVAGHLGLTPQTASDYKVKGRNKKEAEKIKDDAKNLSDAGCSLIVLECIPEYLASEITDILEIPTIGIGAGRYTSGQVLVFNDITGMFDKFVPKFVRSYSSIKKDAEKAVGAFCEDVKKGIFPSEKEIFKPFKG